MLRNASLIIVLMHKKTLKCASEKESEKKSKKKKKRLRRYLHFEIKKNNITLKFCIEFLF